MSTLLDELTEAVGPTHVLTGDTAGGFESDWTGRFRGAARAVVRPANSREVASVIGACRVHRAAVIVQGGNTGLVGGSVPRDAGSTPDQVVVSTVRLTGTGPIDPLTGQVTVGAGVTLAALQELVRGSGWRFGVDLGARDSATIGGMVATNAGGLRVIAHGMMRRQVLGVAAVLGGGLTVSRLGGLEKDNTGFDLSGLLCGSEGTLGVVTDVRLRLIPEPENTVVALVGVSNLDEAAELTVALRRCRGIEAIEFMTDSTAELAAVFGGIDRPFRPWPPIMVLAEACGSDPVDALGSTLEAAPVASDVAVATHPAARRNLWALRELTTTALAGRSGAMLKLDVTVPPSSLAGFAADLGPAISGHASPEQLWIFGHLGDGNLHVNIALDPAEGDREATARALTGSVLELVATHRGSISAEHGIGVAKREWLHLSRSADEIAAMVAIKAALDPDGIMNPGVLLG